MNAEAQKAAKVRVWTHLKHFPLAIREIAKVMEFGSNKPGRKPGGWVEGYYQSKDEDYFTNALNRHQLDEVDDEFDSESGLLHKAHIACNALMDLEVALQREEMIAAGMDPSEDLFDDGTDDGPEWVEMDMNLEEFLNMLDYVEDSNEDPTVLKNTPANSTPWAHRRVLPKQGRDS